MDAVLDNGSAAFADGDVRKSKEIDFALIESYDATLRERLCRSAANPPQRFKGAPLGARDKSPAVSWFRGKKGAWAASVASARLDSSVCIELLCGGDFRESSCDRSIPA